MDTRPIGVLDSGVGGLTVWKEIVKQLPQESTIYIGDSKNVPYGVKPADEIFRLASFMLRFLEEQHVKLIVVACNTITVSSLEKLREMFTDLPIIGTVPVIKTAARVTKNKKIGILSTTQTAKSDYQKHLIDTFAKDLEVLNIGTDKLVPLVEKGLMEGEEVDLVLSEEMMPFKTANVDVIALGCTHFPFLKNSMQAVVGGKVTLLDSAPAVARQVSKILENNDAFAQLEEPKHSLFTTSNEDLLRLIAGKAGIYVDDIRHIILE